MLFCFYGVKAAEASMIIAVSEFRGCNPHNSFKGAAEVTVIAEAAKLHYFIYA